MEERRSARIGTVSGLALLAGATAVAATAGGAHSIFATFLLGLLALGMCHSLFVEIRRQARRRIRRLEPPGHVNAVLLAGWAGRADGDVLPGRSAAGGRRRPRLGYATSCGYFVPERRRTIALARRLSGRVTAARPTDPAGHRAP